MKKTSSTVKKKSVAKAAKRKAARPVVQRKVQRPPEVTNRAHNAIEPKTWLTVFLVVAIFGIAIAGALIFNDSTKSESKVANSNTAGVKLAVNSDTNAAQIEYRYTWSGPTLSNDTPGRTLVSIPSQATTEADFLKVSQALGLGDSVRSVDYGDGIIGYESGAQSNSDDINSNAYQLTGNSNLDSYWYSLLPISDWIEDHPDKLPSEEQAKSIASDFFRTRNLLPVDIGGPYVRDPNEVALRISSSSAAETTARIVYVYFTRLVNGAEVVDVLGEPIEYLTLEIGGEQKILSASGPFIKESTQTQTGQLGKSETDAYTEITQDLWGPGQHILNLDRTEGPIRTMKVVLTSVVSTIYLVPSAGTDAAMWYEPGFLFTGTISDEAGTYSQPVKIIVPAIQNSRFTSALETVRAVDDTTDTPVPY